MPAPSSSTNGARPNSRHSMDQQAPSQAAPLVGTQSKQAKLLGVNPGIGNGVTWNGWNGSNSAGTSDLGPPSPRGSVVGGDGSPWEPRNRLQSSAGTSMTSPASIRATKSIAGARIGDTASINEKKKKSLFGLGKLKQLGNKSSRVDLRDENRGVDTGGFGEFTGGVPIPGPGATPENLPPKLVARGDALASEASLGPASKRSRGPKAAWKPPSRSGALGQPTGPVPARQQSIFPADPGIQLDTDVQDMAGIVNFAHVGSQSHSLPPGMTRSTSWSNADGELDDSMGPLAHSGDATMLERAMREGSAASNGSGNGVPNWGFGGEGISGPLRPGLQRLQTSGSVLEERRSSAAQPPPSAPAGVWTAPDSWAVKADMAGTINDDSTDDEDGVDEDGLGEEDGSDGGLSPPSRKPATFGSMDGESANGRPGTSSGRPGTSAGRPGTRSGRPGTSDGMGRFMAQKQVVVRIHRQDGHGSFPGAGALPREPFSSIQAPLTATTSELLSTLSRKMPTAGSAQYQLYMKEKGQERRLGANEKPILLQKRRLEQAGYTELDKLEDLARENNSYLCKMIYRPPQAMQIVTDDDFADGIEFIDLSSRNIETVPIPLYRQAHQIVSLNLSKNRPFDLPGDFIQICTTLRELILSHMGIKRIPQSVKDAVSLTRLDVSNNHIVDFEHIALNEVGELTSLKCHNNRLWQLPSYFAQFKMLKYLNLSNNRFDTFPPVVCEIPSLVELDVSFNTISTIPLEIGQLVNLERLLLLGNSLNALPATLSDLTHLKELDCRRNQLGDLSAVSGIPRLEVLRVDYNQASVLDGNWQHMRLLNAPNNSISRFNMVGTNNTLTSLNLSHGKLATLAPDMFEHLGSVEVLNFDDNQIRVLPDGIGLLQNLQTLSMRNNVLSALPTSIGGLQRLQSLLVSGNNLQTLPAEIWHCSSLIVLNASSNLLGAFPDPPPSATSSDPMSVEELDSRKLSTISKAPSTASARLVPPLALSLQKLYLGDNNLGDDVFICVAMLTELRVLNLSFNSIYDVLNGFLFKHQQLEELYLSGNKLSSVPTEDLERLISLKYFYLNANKLQTLPSELHKVKNLMALDVGSNVLKYNIANWPYDWNWNYNLELRYLNLSGNKRLEIKPGQQQHDLPSVSRTSLRAGARQPRNLADFSSLSRLHVLGLMDVTLMIPSPPEESEDRRVRTSPSVINDMAYGIADTMGARPDVLSLVDIVIPKFRAKDDEAIFGLFDAVSRGPNTGSKLVKYLVDSFSAIFTLELSRLKNVELTQDALRRAFLGLNRDYGNLVMPQVDTRRKDSETSLADRGSPVRTGAAGIIVYIRKKRMFVANAGNALAVISGRGGSARLLSKKHEPFEAAEIARIRTAEGWISARGAVNDEIDISRSFGFYTVFPAINAAPDVVEVELIDSDEFVIIANRGLWDYMSHQTAVDIARSERGDPMIAAAKLRDLAIAYGSTENIMVMVVNVQDIFKAKTDYRSRLHGAREEPDVYGQRAGQLLRRPLKDATTDRRINALDQEVAAPTGELALVFTDIKNSTMLWDTMQGMQTAIRMHNELLRRQLRSIGGYEVKTEGDAFMAAFPTVWSATLWCLTVQVELLRLDWPQDILECEDGKEIFNARGELLRRGLSVRMGIHWGQPVCEADPITRRMDYFGPMVNRASRISSVAEGGQIAVSQDVIELIEQYLLEKKPRPSSLDSDSGSDSEDDHDLHPSEKQDIMAIRRLGLAITLLGERRLKGLETPELVSLLWPSSLKDRKEQSAADAPVQVEVHEPTEQLLDHSVIRELGRICQRLEGVAALLVHPERLEGYPGDLQATVTLRKALFNPTLLGFTGIRQDSTDEELAAVLDHLIGRIEHSLSTLVLHQLGPFAEVLAALGSAIKTDPRYIMMAMSRFGALMGPTDPTTNA